MPDLTYQEKLKEEAEIWSKNAEAYYGSVAPDFRALINLHDYWLFLPWYRRFFNTLKPGDRVLELGCGSGWFTLEMARYGAQIDAVDIAEGAIAIARRYYDQVRQTETLAGSINYQVLDVNQAPMPADHYDWVVMTGMLHHAPNPRQLLEDSKRWLKPSGRVFIFDPLDTTPRNSLLAGAFMLISPTHLSYREKFGHLLRVRSQAVNRLSVAIEGRGLSPFEGVGRTDSPRAVIAAVLKVDVYREGYGITSFLSREISGPRWLARGLLLAIRPLEWALRKLRVIGGLRYIAFARRE